MLGPTLMMIAVTGAGVQPRPIGQSAEPLTLWTSGDQLEWKPAELRSMLAGGSYPELLHLTKATPSRSGPDAGEVLLYLSGEGGCTCARTIDQGRTWGEASAVSFSGLPAELKGKSLGPLTAVQLDDGRVRVYFAEDVRPARPANPFVRPPADPKPLAPTIPDLPKPPGSPGRTTLPPGVPTEGDTPGTGPTGQKPTVVRSAISNDGLRFAVEDGVRFELAGAGGPEVVRLPTDSRDGQSTRPGRWLMFMNRGGSIVLAHSKDGLAWTRDETFSWDDVEHADATVAKGGSPGSVRVWAIRNKQVVSGVFDPAAGGEVVEDPGLRLPDNGQDASVCPLGDGTFLLIRRQIAADKTVIPPARPEAPVRPPAVPRSP
ncbi:MAG: hypothetical protein ACK4WH_01990 [Phycisphaerales bacterium]